MLFARGGSRLKRVKAASQSSTGARGMRKLGIGRNRRAAGRSYKVQRQRDVETFGAEFAYRSEPLRETGDRSHGKANSPRNGPNSPDIITQDADLIITGSDQMGSQRKLGV